MILALLCLLAQEPSLEQALRQLGDESPELRDRASAWIYGRGAEAVPALQKALAGAEPEVRGRVETLLHRIEWEPLVPVSLLARLPEARSAFHRGDHAGFIEVLRERAGWEHGGAEELEAYAVRLLRCPEPELQGAAVEILELATRERDAVFRRPVGAIVDFLCRRAPKEWDDVERQALYQIGDLIHRRASPRDLRILADAKPLDPRAERLLRLLRAGLGDAVCTPPLLAALASDEAPWQFLALMAAEKSGCKAAAPAVAKLLDSDQMSWMAWQVMPRVFDPAVGGALVAACHRETWTDRVEGKLRLLLAVGTPEAMRLFRDAVKIESAQQTAVALMAERGDRAGVPLVLEEYVRTQKATNAFILAGLIDETTVDRFLALLDSPQQPLRFSIAYSFWAIGDPEARRKALLRFEQERDPELRRVMLEGMATWGIDLGERLEKLARDVKDPMAPTAAVMLVGQRGAAALPFVESLLDQGVPFLPRIVAPLLRHAPPPLLLRLGRDSELGGAAGFEILWRLEELGARKELTAYLVDKSWHALAAILLLRLGEKPEDYLKTHADDISWGELDSAAGRDVPGVRDFLRARWKAGKIDEFSTQAFRFWAFPEMLPGLRKRLAQYDASRAPDVGDPQAPEMCAMSLLGRNSGYDALSAISATGDPAALPILLERLNDPEPGMQATAMKALGRRKAAEAVPILRQIVLSGRSWLRGRALFALAEIGAPGTEAFLRAQLRDNPTMGPAALARLGVDAREELRALLADGVPPGPVLGAIDLMANPDLYKGIDTRLPSLHPTDLALEIGKLTGRPCRITRGVGDRGLGAGGWETPRDFLLAVEAAGCTHRVREGVIVICTLDEAR